VAFGLNSRLQQNPVNTAPNKPRSTPPKNKETGRWIGIELTFGRRQEHMAGNLENLALPNKHRLAAGRWTPGTARLSVG